MGRQGLCLNLGKGMSEQCRTEVEEGFHVIHCEKLDLYIIPQDGNVYTFTIVLPYDSLVNKKLRYSPNME